MDALRYINIALRLVIWLLLTADLSLANIIIGVSIAWLLPPSYTSLGAIKDWLKVLWQIIVAIPQAYIEAIQIILSPHNDEELVCEQIKPRRTPGLIFLDIFLITFTPKTIVLKYHEQGWYEIHRVRRSKKR